VEEEQGDEPSPTPAVWCLYYPWNPAWSQGSSADLLPDDCLLPASDLWLEQCDSESLKPVDKPVPIDPVLSDRCDFVGSSHGSGKPEPGIPSVHLAREGTSEEEVPEQPCAVSRSHGQNETEDVAEAASNVHHQLTASLAET